MMTTFGERNLITNLKAFLIILVVAGHLIQLLPFLGGFREGMILWIYSFHMPAFVFVSGYLSKNADKRRKRAFVDALIPFFIFQILVGLLNLALSGESVVFANPLHPEWAMWYLFALFIWRITLPDVSRIRGIIPISVVISILTGYFTGIGNAFAAQRTLGYFVFFLLGYFCSSDVLKQTRRIRPVLAGTVLMAELVGFIYFTRYNLLDFGEWWSIFSHQAVYDPTIPWKMALLYLIALSVGTVNTALCIAATTGKEHRLLRETGCHTLPIYLSHTVVFLFARKFCPLIQNPVILTVVMLFLIPTCLFLFSREWYARVFMGFLNACRRAVIWDDRHEQDEFKKSR